MSATTPNLIEAFREVFGDDVRPSHVDPTTSPDLDVAIDRIENDRLFAETGL